MSQKQTPMPADIRCGEDIHEYACRVMQERDGLQNTLAELSRRAESDAHFARNAEGYLINKYGAVSTSFSWRAEAEAFEAGQRQATKNGNWFTCPVCEETTALLSAKFQPAQFLRPASEYHEDYHDVIWFHFHTFEECPEAFIGSSQESNFEEEHWTHFIQFDFNSIIDQAEAMGVKP